MPRKSGLIDERDKKILAELDINARQTDSKIAKKLKISKQVANYRIQKLVDSGVVNNFYTMVNVGNLGLNTYYIFLQLEKINKEQEKKLLEKLNSLDYVGWLVSCMGRWDVIININVDSVYNFEKHLNEILGICGKHLHEYIFTTLLDAEHLGYKFLLNSKQGPHLYQGEKQGTFKIDVTDEKILRVLSQDARISLTEMSGKLRIPFHILNYRLKKLLRKGIIEGFRPKLNVGKLGYQWHLLLIQFSTNDSKRKKDLIDFCKNNKKVYYLTNTVGNYNLMLDVHVENVEQLRDLTIEIKDKFSDLIRLYESVLIFEEYKISYIPKGITTAALLFDLDGTLVNTEKFDGKILSKILKNHGLKSSLKFSGYNLEDYIARITPDKKIQKTIKKDFMAEYQLTLKNVQLEINKELLKYVRLGGDPLVALVTANNRKLTETILKKTGLLKYFDVIITSEDVKQQKPHPEPYLKAIRELNVDPKNCIAFEDSKTGMESAKAAHIAIVRRVIYR